MAQIFACGSDYDDYLRDESRSVGFADSIAFPESEQDVRDIMAQLYEQGIPVTVQGARSGLAAGAVPHGGCVLNTSRMKRVLGLRKCDGEEVDPDAARPAGDALGCGGAGAVADVADAAVVDAAVAAPAGAVNPAAGPSAGGFVVRVHPGLSLMELREMLHSRAFDTQGWDEESLEALEALRDADLCDFLPDPTETSAALGGVVACNASGARSFSCGPARPHVVAMRVCLADGDMLSLRRGEVFATGRRLQLTTEGGRSYDLQLPTYIMPNSKNASGYYVADDMDAIDLFIGACGTLGVICELELRVCPVPAEIWGVNCFFPAEDAALDFVEAVRERVGAAAAVEFFDAGALDILRSQRATNPALSAVPELADDAHTCVYVELRCDDEDAAEAQLERLAELLDEAGGSEDAWVATDAADREKQRVFRHAVPASVNALIDERRRAEPSITKLGSDMSVPDERLRDVFAMYRETLAAEGFESATWGHVGDNHVHVNILPRNAEEYARGTQLFSSWAAKVSAMGGAVSAEHGVGKLKAHFLEVMYGPEHIAECARLKLQLDAKAQLGRGNLFSEELLDQMR
jgi:D-lactate dehydrogenase (cytochrome)